MGKGSSATTNSSSGSSTMRPDDAAYQAYQSLLQRASGVAATPYEAYGGEEVAPINQQQTAGIGNINTQQGVISATGAPLSAADIQRYQDPYTQSVIEATQRDFDVQNARQQSQVTGSAAAQGALGGDRSAVAAALAAEAQGRTQAPIIAGLRSRGYEQATKTAEGQQQQALRAGVAGLQGAQAQVGAGTLQQQTQQALDTQNRQDYYQKQGYPFQVAQWLAQIDTGVGSQMGGTSTSTGQGTTQGPTPNPWAQIAGVGLTAASMFSDRRMKENIQKVGETNDGQPIYRFNYKDHPQTQIGLMHDEVEDTHPEATSRVGGVGVVDYRKATDDSVERFSGGRVSGVHGYAGGGSPWGTEQTWIPQVSGITAGRGAPSAPSLPAAPSAPQQRGLTADQMRGVGTLARSGEGAIGNWMNGDPGSFESPMAGLSSADYDPSGPGVFHRGGRVRRYANGGFAYGGAPDEDPTFDDRFNASYPQMAAGVGAARPAFADVSPEEPIRMPPPEAVDAWRAGVDRDRGSGLTESATESAPLPPEVISGRSKPVLEPAQGPEEGPSEALAYDSGRQPVRGVAAPAAMPEGAPDESWLSKIGVKMTPELRQGMLQAGLAMMATNRGGPGSFLQAAGEAGMAGVGAYSQSQQLALAQAEKQRKEAFEREKFERPYSEMTAAQKAIQEREYKPTYGVVRKEVDPETGFSKDIYGWINPNKQTITEAPAPAVAVPSTPATGPAGYDYSRTAPRVEKGAEVPEPKGLSGKSASSIKADAEYYAQTGKLPPVRAGQSPVAIVQQNYRNAVQNYGNALAESRGINPSQLAEMWRTAPGTLRFVLGADGRATVSLGTAVRHLDTLKILADAWAAGDMRIINQAKAAVAKQFGGEAATNLEAAGRIIGPEIVKAIGVAGAGTAEERKAVKSAFSTSASPAQMLGAIRTTQALLGGQLEGRKRQASAAGVSEQKFKELIGDRPYEVLTSAEKGHGAAPSKETSMPTISSKAEYDKLLGGTKFMKNGKEWTKP